MTLSEQAPKSESMPPPRSKRRPMEVLAEDQTPDNQPSHLTNPAPMTATTASQMTAMTRSVQTSDAGGAYLKGAMGAINVLSQVLAARLIVLIAIVGAIGLAWVALANPDPYRIAVLGAYLLAGLVPCVWLSSRGK